MQGKSNWSVKFAGVARGVNVLVSTASTRKADWLGDGVIPYSLFGNQNLFTFEQSNTSQWIIIGCCPFESSERSIYRAEKHMGTQVIEATELKYDLRCGL